MPSGVNRDNQGRLHDQETGQFVSGKQGNQRGQGRQSYDEARQMGSHMGGDHEIVGQDHNSGEGVFLDKNDRPHRESGPFISEKNVDFQ